MAKENTLPTTVTTPRFRNSYPAVFSPKLNKLSGQMEFSVQALFEAGADLTMLKKAAENACTNKWGPDKTKWPTNLKSPFKMQAELIEAAKKKGRKADSHLDPKAAFMNFKTNAKDKNGKDKPHPIVVGKDPKQVIEDEKEFYAGCWAKASVNAGAYERGANFGVTFYLQALQFVGNAERFGGFSDPTAAFEAIPDDVMEPGEAGSDATSMFS